MWKKIKGSVRDFELLLILPPIFLIAIVFSTPLIDINEGFDTDGLVYGAMASKGDFPLAWLSRTSPLCYRVLTPFLVSLLPFEILTNFKVWVFFSNWLSIVFLYLLFQKMNLSKTFSMIGVLFYIGIFWTIKFSFYSPAYIDFQTLLLLIINFYLIVNKKFWILPASIGISILQKEIFLFLIPFAILYSWTYSKEMSLKRLTQFFLLLIVPIFCFFIPRIFIDPINSYSPLKTLLFNFKMIFFPHRFYPRFFLSIFSGLGVLPLILILHWKGVGKILNNQKYWILWLLIGVLLLFGGVDKSRLYLPLAPLIAYLAVCSIQRENPSWNIWFALWIGGTLILHFYLGNLLTPMGNSNDYINRLVPMHSKVSLYPLIGNRLALSFLWLFFSVILQKKIYLVNNLKNLRQG